MFGRSLLLLFAVVVSAAVFARADDHEVFSEWLNRAKDPAARAVSDTPPHTKTVCLKESVDQNCLCSSGYMNTTGYLVCQDDYVE